MAHAATISCDPEVLGEGPLPSTLTDSTVFFPGADLRGYGRRRARFFKALHDKAVALALEWDVLLFTSEDTAAVCSLLGMLDSGLWL
jgi:hypothetical protein